MRRHVGYAVVITAFLLSAGAWAAGRAYLQIAGIRQLPRLSSSLVISEMKRFKPHVECMFAEAPVYSFHAGIPMPPNLAVLPLKRFWSGEIANARLNAELRAAAPGIILLANDAREVPFEDLLRESYRLIYHDERHRLYASLKAVKATGWDPGIGNDVQWEVPRAVPPREGTSVPPR